MDWMDIEGRIKKKYWLNPPHTFFFWFGDRMDATNGKTEVESNLDIYIQGGF